jgi:hypothetical protein
MLEAVRRVAPILVLASACAQEIVVSDRDAGPGPGPRDGGDVVDPRDAGRRDAGPARDAGPKRDAGIPPRDAGPRDAGPDVPVSWGVMTLPPDAQRSVLAVWGRSPAEVWAGNGSGGLLGFDPASGWQKVWQEPSNFQIQSIGGTPNRLFVASESALHVFEGDHTGTRATYGISMVRSLRQMAVRSDTEAYVVASLQNGRGLYRYDGSDLVTIIEPTDVAELEAVAAIPGQPIFVGGNGRIYRYESATLTQETIEWPARFDDNDKLLFTFEGFGEIDGHIYAVGDHQMAFERHADRTWRVAYDPSLSNELHAVGGVGGEGFAVGRWTPQGPIARVRGGGWSRDVITDRFDLVTLWAADENTYFAAGWITGTFDGVVLRGTR